MHYILLVLRIKHLLCAFLPRHLKHVFVRYMVYITDDKNERTSLSDFKFRWKEKLYFVAIAMQFR